ncbi:hypothetical protein SDC9_187451 [bioreactor metagenome]|uniref:Uncharacterized protein n=1 Tax=bioreactor metagenome TaxID=1076179 RepID=A0A645HLW6_9ZZZZ
MMIVSIKVPVMVTRPWRTGSFVCAAAAAIGALPRPASFEKIPRAIPFCMATITATSAPPAAARNPNALWKISTRAPGIARKFTIRRSRQMVTYAIAIKGTMTCATLAILFKPPIITRPANKVTNTPDNITAQEYSLPKRDTVKALLGSKKLLTAEVMPLIWVKVPIPRSPQMVPKKANTLASHFQFGPMPVSM